MKNVLVINQRDEGSVVASASEQAVASLSRSITADGALTWISKTRQPGTEAELKTSLSLRPEVEAEI